MEQELTSLIGEALLDAARGLFFELGTRRDEAFTWIREVARAPPGLELRAPDGAVYTGVAVIDRGRVIVLVAFRHDLGAPFPRETRDPPIVLTPPQWPDRRQLFDELPWDQHVDPYRRR